MSNLVLLLPLVVSCVNAQLSPTQWTALMIVYNETCALRKKIKNKKLTSWRQVATPLFAHGLAQTALATVLSLRV
jgi:hypothetical protein